MSLNDSNDITNHRVYLDSRRRNLRRHCNAVRSASREQAFLHHVVRSRPLLGTTHRGNAVLSRKTSNSIVCLEMQLNFLIAESYGRVICLPRSVDHRRVLVRIWERACNLLQTCADNISYLSTRSFTDEPPQDLLYYDYLVKHQSLSRDVLSAFTNLKRRQDE